MKRILFRRIILAYLVIAPLLLIILELYLSGAIKDNYISNLRDGLIIQARLIADRIPGSDTHDLDQFCRDYKEKTGARVTIVDSDGKVLGDSDEPSGKMENHLDRPEIKEADLSDMGTTIRYSRTLQKNLFYLAIAFESDSDRKFLRLSMPLQDIEKAMNSIRMRIVTATLAVSFLAILLGLIQARRITRSVEEITAFSKEAAAGHFRKRLFLREKGELGELGKNISEMAHELHEKLKLSEEGKQKIEAILRNMSDGLILSDMKGTILLSNEAVSRLFNVASSIEGKTIMETLRKAELMDMIDKVAVSRERVSREIEVTHPKDLYLMVTAAPFYAYRKEGELSGIILTFHDITRLRRLEEIRKDFVANVSHEIKTPITAIKGFTETLLDGAIDDRENAHKFLETIKINSERLNSLVTDLLTLSGIELGDIVIQQHVVNPEEVIDTVFTILAEKSQSKRLYLRKDVAPEIRELKADRDRLIQILLNLVDNGIKFTEQGGVTIKVRSEKVKAKNADETEAVSSASNLQPSASIIVSVEDTGIGIPKKHLTRLGERFYRVDRARSRELGGTGLGLAIVKHLVKAHGWEMEIESTEGQGTTVRILCPPV
ncbi:MAG TPA: ATP-binding protein [Thermodesulfovibrionales bacterium]|jgi:two-component system phosphate regulon sensor histidine kinase PhoR|nr:ATP-binding protein [Thermodesulfovibrionales bacterium]